MDKPPLVLVVEDEQLILGPIQDALEEGGFGFEAVSSGEQAGKLLERYRRQHHIRQCGDRVHGNIEQACRNTNEISGEPQMQDLPLAVWQNFVLGNDTTAQDE